MSNFYNDAKKSIYSLMKTNNGQFKSEKQSKFFNEAFDGEFCTSTTVYNHTVYTFFYFDDKGIYRVNKQHTVKGEEVITKMFDRDDVEWNKENDAKKAKAEERRQKKIAKAKAERENMEKRQAIMRELCAFSNVAIDIVHRSVMERMETKFTEQLNATGMFPAEEVKRLVKMQVDLFPQQHNIQNEKTLEFIDTAIQCPKFSAYCRSVAYAAFMDMRRARHIAYS